MVSGRGATALQRAVAYVKNQKWNEAKEQLAIALTERPDDAEANYYLGVTDEALGDRAGAQAAYKKALTSDPSLAEAATNLAALYLDEAENPPKPDEAITVLQGALSKKPGDVALLRNLGYAYGLKHDVANASQAYDAALAKGEDPQIRFAYGTLLVENKELDKGAVQLKKALEGVGDDAPMLASIGMMLGYSKAYGDCVGAYDRALKQKPAQAEWLTRRGTCKHGLKDEKGAMSDFEAATKADPNNAAAHYYLGEALLANEKRSRAFDEFTSAAKLGANTPIGKAATERLTKLTDVAAKRKGK
jgi:tetratricopeptide (TPR) repeat protein